MRSGRAVAVSALLAVVAVNLLAACAPGDDADVFPTPTPEPVLATHCQIVWTQQNTQVPSQLDVFVVDAPEEAWIAGVNTFGEFTAYYQPGLEAGGNVFPMTILDTRGGVVTATPGSFEIVAGFNGTDDGADIEIASTTTATLMTIDDEGEPTEDVFGQVELFGFQGEWSEREGTSVVLGTGAADVTLGSGTNTTPVVLGDFGTFAICYDPDAL